MPLIIYLLTFFVSMTSENKATLIYIGDPMCSWCYGIAPELDKVKNHFDDDINYEIVLGGLRPYNTQVMTELKDFLTDHWHHVNEASGQPFNYNILNDSSITYDTEPPCRAVVAVRQINNSKALDFFKYVQGSFYAENNNMHKVESYFGALEKVGIEKSEFEKIFNSDQLKADVKQDFLRASQLGVRSFPTILLHVNGEYHPIAKGYAKSEEMINRINNYL